MCLGCVNYDWTTGPVKWLPVVSKVRNDFFNVGGGALIQGPPLSHQTYWAIKMDSLWVDGVSTPAKLTAVRPSVPSCASQARLMPRSCFIGNRHWYIPDLPADRRRVRLL